MTELTQAHIDAWMPRRAPDSDKNTYGRVLCVCGSRAYCGAAYFAAQGAVRMGSGIVTVALPEAIWSVLACKLNEPVLCPLPTAAHGGLSCEGIQALCHMVERADAVLIGCGMGNTADTARIVEAVLTCARVPVIVDADGINVLAPHMDIVRQRTCATILTPHAREFFRLSGLEHPQDAQLCSFAAQYGVTLVYKGHRTRIACPDGRLFYNTTGNPGMAKGGSGDVLAGMILALCGQGMDAPHAACAAVWLHGQAGDHAANALSEYSMTPTDLLAQLCRVTRRYNTREW